jgi:hypothetical protein
MLVQHTPIAPAGVHPLVGTAVEYVWLLPLLPLLGFVVNGLLALVAVYRPGPSDPTTDHHDHQHDHGTAHEPAPTTADRHATRADAAGDDHHPHARHRFAGAVSLVGPGVLFAAFALSVAMFAAMLGTSEAHTPLVQRYFTWMPAGDLVIEAALQVDRLSIVMALVVTGVGALIHAFSVGYMRDDPGYPRYFAYLNLFVFFMLVLVLGANYPVLFVGWEGVGLCSYLLIGFWFAEKPNADAGKKAFIVNRIGDFGFLVAMFLLFYVVPRFGHIYEERGADLPLFSRLLLGWGKAVDEHALLVLGVLGVFCVLGASQPMRLRRPPSREESPAWSAVSTCCPPGMRTDDTMGENPTSEEARGCFVPVRRCG